MAVLMASRMGANRAFAQCGAALRPQAFVSSREAALVEEFLFFRRRLAT
jgi:hypothetical protein